MAWWTWALVAWAWLASVAVVWLGAELSVHVEARAAGFGGNQFRAARAALVRVVTGVCRGIVLRLRGATTTQV